MALFATKSQQITASASDPNVWDYIYCETAGDITYVPEMSDTSVTLSMTAGTYLLCSVVLVTSIGSGTFVGFKA